MTEKTFIILLQEALFINHYIKVHSKILKLGNLSISLALPILYCYAFFILY